MGAPIRSSTEITQIITRSQHALADLGTQLVDEEKRGITSIDTGHRDKMYRLILLRSFLHNILDDNADVRAYYTASVNEKKFNKILDGLVQLSQSFSGPGINIIGVRRNLLFFTGSGTGGGGGGPANPGGTTFQNLDVSSPSETVDTFDANTSTFALYVYSVLGSNSGEGSRTGMIIASWNGSNDPTYAETRTEDVGGITSPLTFKVELNAGQIELNAYAATDGWVVKGVRILFTNISFINPTGGLPVGGNTGQFLRKASGVDGDATWQTLIWTMLTDVTASLAEINRVSGVTGPIQTQLDTLTTNLTALSALLANYLLLSGGTLTGKLFLGSGTVSVPDVSIGKLKSSFVNADAARFYINAIFQSEQQIATTFSIQALEGYTKLTHPSGIVALALATIGNLELNSVATLTEGRAIQAGIVITAAGHADALKIFYGGMANAGGGTVDDAYGLFLESFPAGITRKWNLYILDTAATSLISGKVRMPNLPESSAGLPSGSLWNNAGVVNIVP